MKSSNWIATYLLKDALCRLWENKLATLARLFVAALLGFASLVVMAGVATESQNVKERVEALGARTILVRSTGVSNWVHEAGMIALQEPGAPGGILLKRHLVSAVYNKRWDIPVYTYQPKSANILPHSPSRDGIFSVTNGTKASLFHLLDHELVAQPIPAHPPLKPLGREKALLLPEGLIPEIDHIPFKSIYLVEAGSDEDLLQLQTQLEKHFQGSPGPAPTVESAQALLQLLHDLESRRNSWRILLSTLSGGTLALVFGAVSLFMYRENLYVYTLVKSFGLEPRWIFLAVLMENLSIALAGGAIGLVAALPSAHHLYASLGMGSEILFPREDIPLLAVSLVASAILASLPVLKALQQPVGEVLA